MLITVILLLLKDNIYRKSIPNINSYIINNIRNITLFVSSYITPSLQKSDILRLRPNKLFIKNPKNVIIFVSFNKINIVVIVITRSLNQISPHRIFESFILDAIFFKKPSASFFNTTSPSSNKCKTFLIF